MKLLSSKSIAPVLLAALAFVMVVAALAPSQSPVGIESSLAQTVKQKKAKIKKRWCATKAQKAIAAHNKLDDKKDIVKAKRRLYNRYQERAVDATEAYLNAKKARAEAQVKVSQLKKAKYGSFLPVKNIDGKIKSAKQKLKARTNKKEILYSRSIIAGKLRDQSLQQYLGAVKKRDAFKTRYDILKAQYINAGCQE